MPTSRAAALLTFSTLLGACLGTGEETTRDAPASVSVTDAGIVVAGPPGFCIDLDSSRSRARHAFVLLASCAAISNQPLSPQPDFPVVLMASVASGAATSISALERYFRSPSGMANLRSHGTEATRLEVHDEALFVYTESRSGNSWRGIVPLGSGSIVTVTLKPTSDAALHEQTRLDALDAFVARILAANPDTVLAAKSLQPRAAEYGD